MSSLFKLNKMDNAGYERDCDRRGTVELGAVVYQQEPMGAPTTTLNGNSRQLTGCSEQCLKLHQQHELQHQLHLQKSDQKPQSESPWHHLKTIFLVGTIVFLAIWVLVYTLLSQLDML